MKKKLNKIADIRLGHHFREKIPVAANGNYFVIQMKDVDNVGCIAWGGLTKIAAEKINDEVLAREGEIIFSNRGSRNYAALVDRSVAKVIVVGNFFIIRVKEASVSPAYLAWYLNEKRAQKHFDQHREGSYIPTLRGEWLKELDVLIPNLQTQEEIVALDQLRRREMMLKAAIQEKHDLLIRELILKKIEERL